MQTTKQNGSQTPLLLKKSSTLAAYLKTLSSKELQQSMKISEPVAKRTHQQFKEWSVNPSRQSTAIDSFIGDIYSGLQAHTLSKSERDYANKNLVILSGLYGLLRPYDGIMPYRTEMAYKFSDNQFHNLYKYWGDSIAKILPSSGIIMNLSSVEYSKTVTSYIDNYRVITPKFYTISPKTKLPTFVTVHSKIARGAFARWLIVNQVTAAIELEGFDLLGYEYDANLSEVNQPAYVAEDFGGIGLSIRLDNKEKK